MKLISDYQGKILELVQPKLLSEEYQLLNGEEVLGTLKFSGAFNKKVEAEISNHLIEIKTENFWKDIIGIYKPGNELPHVKVVPQKMRESEIQFYRGDYLTVRQYFLKSVIEVLNNMGEIILSVRSKSGFKKKYLIEIVKKNKLVDDNPWILLLLGYMVIKKEKRAYAG